MRNHFIAQGRDDVDLEVRADIGLRMGVLGLGSAAATIFGALALQGDTSSLVIGAGLSSTALTGLNWLRYTKNLQVPYLAVGASWIAGLTYFTTIHPVAGSTALAASLALIGRAQIFRGPISEDGQDTSPSQKIGTLVVEEGLRLDPSGHLTVEARLGGLALSVGDQIIERVHISDRVQFLRTLSQLRSGEVSDSHLRLRINVASKSQAARFEEFDFEMSMRGDAVELQQSVKPDVEVEPAQTREESGSDKRFLAIVSHELRTPLNAIIGFSEVLRGDLNKELPENTRSEYIDLIHGAGTHLLSLVNTILDVAKIESGTYKIDREAFDFKQTARECMAMLGAQAKQKNIMINDRITCPSSNVHGDRRAVKQMLINLLSNAVKYTEPNGFVTVDAQIDDAEFAFEVSDTGIGMSADDLKMVAKPFTQVDNPITRRNEGTGLGLALVKGLVELHGGKLEISSKLGVGTNVKIRIPSESGQVQSGNLSELRPLNWNDTRQSSGVNERQSFAGKGIEHGTRKAG